MSQSRLVSGKQLRRNAQCLDLVSVTALKVSDLVSVSCENVSATTSWNIKQLHLETAQNWGNGKLRNAKNLPLVFCRMVMRNKVSIRVSLGLV